MAVGSTSLDSSAIDRPSFGLATETMLAGAILFCVALQLHLAFTKSVNWDEFRFLADIHLHGRGELTSRLQSFHVHFLSWLRWLPADEIGQVVAGRLAMLLIECLTIGLIYRCARHFMPPQAALLAVLCYASFSFVIRHGASLRFDPPSIALMMGAAALLLEAPARRRSMLLAGLMVAVAGLVTIKSAFMLPTLAVIAAYRLQVAPDRRAAAVRLAYAAVSAPIFFALLFLVHDASLGASGTDSTALATHSAAKTLGHGELLPQASAALRAVLGNPVAMLLIAGGAVRTIMAIGQRTAADRLRAAALLAFAIPLLTPLFYRNSYPYYYAWIMAPAVLLAGVALPRRLAPRLMQVGAVALAGYAALHYGSSLSPTLAVQRATVEAVHSIFPEPTAYIDRASMIAAYPKAGVFMSSWGMQNYRAAGRPIMRDILRTQSPPLVIANAPALEAALGSSGAASPGVSLLAADAAVLRANFIPHWGPLWVAGKRLWLAPGAEPRAFEILVGGSYTVEAAQRVSIDGLSAAPGDIVHLAAGRHSVSAARPGWLVLRWGERLPIPGRRAPTAPLFDGL